MLNLISDYVIERVSGVVLAAILVRHFGEKPVISRTASSPDLNRDGI